MSEPVFTSKADVAYALIRQRILDGTLAAGSKLAQYDLAADLGISITPLREASPARGRCWRPAVPSSPPPSRSRPSGVRTRTSRGCRPR
jgi:hypothetical protein